MKVCLILTLCLGTALSGTLEREKRQANCVEPKLTNVCVQDTTGPIHFPHPTANNKFLQCAPNHRMFVITCPEGEVYHQATTSCDKQQTATTAKPAVINPFPVNPNPVTNPTNPCTPDNLAKQIIFFPYPSDQTKFIECNPQGQPTILSCPPRLVYVAARQSCVFPTGTAVNTGGTNTGTGTNSGTNTGGTVVGGSTSILGTGTVLNSNPCPKDTTQELFFPHPSDPGLYIQCDLAGDAYIMRCPANLIWNQAASYCDTRYGAKQSGGSVVG